MSTYPRSCRLASKLDFQFVFAKPLKVTGKRLLALYRPNDRLNARLGIIIAKQRVRRAVDRNRLRRTIRESFRQCQSSLKGLDIIVLIRSEWVPLEPKIWRNEVDSLWQKMIKQD